VTGLVETHFSVGQSVFRIPFPGIAKKGQKVVIDGVTFVVATDGVVIANKRASIDPLTMAPLPPVYVTATLGTEWTEAARD
jgi:hypothetical protein